MTTICNVATTRSVRGSLSYLSGHAGDSWGYLLICRDVVNGQLCNHRAVGVGCGYESRGEALKAGDRVARRVEREANAKDRPSDHAALRDQVQANRRDPHCAGAY